MRRWTRRRTADISAVLVPLLAALALGSTACERSEGQGPDLVGPSITDGMSRADLDEPDVTATVDSGPAGEDVPAPPCECDDQLLCTRDFCDEAGDCQHEPLSTLNDSVLYQRAPEFSLVDANPASATNGQTFTRQGVTAQADVIVLAFHDASCSSCLEQGEAARAFYAGTGGDLDVFFAAVNGPNSAALVEAYVNADDPDIQAPPPPSTWPVLQDTTAAGVWNSYCADSDVVVVIGLDGRVYYMRAVNFRDPNFITELESAIDRARNATPE
jgi:hypothetical protein